ncbi:cell division ATP-binding protein FtsE [Candidatus Microgenomates bacterium]|nr:MAG: cell division ATP-binding protein FtsE [Candidatus Microgenomates bacterium]
MLTFKNVTKSFGSIKALDNVSFSIDEGEFVFITGKSGAGKTTLLRLLMRELLPTSGEIEFDGEEIHNLKSKKVPELRRKMGVVFQDFRLLGDKTVKENIELALAVASAAKSEWEPRIEHVLNLVGLSDRGDLFPSQLSGGETQRASLARALVVNPKLIFADEPTGNLDWDTADEVMELLDKINKEGKTVIVTTHHKSIIDNYKKRVIEMKKGAIEKDK